jgi:hypothetical protein
MDADSTQIVTVFSRLSVKILHSAWAVETGKARQASTQAQWINTVLRFNVVFFTKMPFKEPRAGCANRMAATEVYILWLEYPHGVEPLQI